MPNDACSVCGTSANSNQHLRAGERMTNLRNGISAGRGAFDVKKAEGPWPERWDMEVALDKPGVSDPIDGTLPRARSKGSCWILICAQILGHTPTHTPPRPWVSAPHFIHSSAPLGRDPGIYLQPASQW
ncbi:hypothetical protein B0T16DRAFT_176717 [Cercophora newfieldiana]|uniref:Uncharacterized protein n=1 Tax=Cercophora newfieldiana TaxID=92897 RepID=A0AA39XZG6_9PEZI|nr:hypothetical protein B0T16DRAFT_176717 [Cercophora newfieldiana]